MIVLTSRHFPSFPMLDVSIVSWNPGRCSSSPHLCGTRYYLTSDVNMEAHLSILQVTALDTGISLNMFYGDPGENVFISKMFREPYRQHFQYWFLNIIEQNRDQQSFQKILSRLPEVCRHFFVKQWHEVPTEDQVRENQRRKIFGNDVILIFMLQVSTLVALVKNHLKIEELPEPIITEGKFPPVLKIRGLLHRDGNKKKKQEEIN